MKVYSKSIIATCLIAASMMTAAHAGDISCPAASAVKGAGEALNTVMRQSPSSYFVFSATPAVNQSGLDWMIVTQASGKGFDAAFANGQSEVGSVMMPVMEEPMEMQGVYVCPYFTSTGSMSVMAIAQAQQDLFFNPMKLNLDKLKIKK